MFDALHNFGEFIVASAVLAGAMAWWRKGTPEEDAMMGEAAEIVVDNLMNADNVTNIEMLTGKNLRDQMTIEEVQDAARERDLRRFGRRN